MVAQRRLRQILEEFRQRMMNVLGDDLESVLLYGSHARGDAVEGSDVDVLCIMKKPFDYGDLILRTSEATAEISLKYDVVISTAFVTRADYESKETPFLLNIRREGVSL